MNAPLCFLLGFLSAAALSSVLALIARAGDQKRVNRILDAMLRERDRKT